jgi:hypothetical protein
MKKGVPANDPDALHPRGLDPGLDGITSPACLPHP